MHTDFDHMAEGFQKREQGHLHAYLREQIAHRFPRMQEIQILDLGCGTGQLVDFFSSSGMAVIGIDISRPLLDRNRASRHLLVLGDGSALPFTDNAFSVVVINHVLRHASNPARILAEAYRVLRVPGLLLVTEFVTADLRRRPVWKLFPRLEEITSKRLVNFPAIANASKTVGFADIEVTESVPVGIRNQTVDQYIAYVRNRPIRDLYCFDDLEFTSCCNAFESDLRSHYDSVVEYELTYSFMRATKAETRAI